MKDSGPRLRWNGSQQAQREAEAAYAKLRLKPKKARRPKRKMNKAERRVFREAERKRAIQQLREMPYKQYLRSSWWKRRKNRAKNDAGHKCERCGRCEGLEVHHKHYRSLGCEARGDLEVLCGGCHRGEHWSMIEANAHMDAIVGR